MNNPTMKLNNKQKNFLKAKAHSLKPVVIIGAKGVSDNLISETNQALSHHALIKLKIPAIDKSGKAQLLDAICQQCKATLVGLTGRIAILFRQNAEDKSKFTLPG